MIVATDDGFTLGGAIDGRVRNLAHQVNEGTTVVDLVVAHDDVVNVLEVNLLFQVLDKLTAIRKPCRVDQRILLISNQVGVVTRAAVS